MKLSCSCARGVGAGQYVILFATVLVIGALTLSGCAGVATQTTAKGALNVQVTNHSVTLSWNPSTSVVVGYRVYRSMQSGAFYTLLTSTLVPGTSFEDLAIQKGQTYYYVVTAVDAESLESGYSNEVFATIPTS
jgi:fibronectin type 3 domain-containing protein